MAVFQAFLAETFRIPGGIVGRNIIFTGKIPLIAHRSSDELFYLSVMNVNTGTQLHGSLLSGSFLESLKTGFELLRSFYLMNVFYAMKKPY